eukprot:5983384-Pyramimonas_sp.AAC.1
MTVPVLRPALLSFLSPLASTPIMTCALSERAGNLNKYSRKAPTSISSGHVGDGLSGRGASVE